MRLPAKEALERTKLAVEIIGLLVGGGFLFGGVVIPWFSNTSGEMEIRTMRAPSDRPGEDYLAIEVRLRRHGTARCDLFSINARVHNPFVDGDDRPVSFATEALSPTLSGVDFKLPRKKPQITLDPDDAFHVSNITRVPRDSPEVVDAVIRCNRDTAGNPPEWRSSTTSFPVPVEKTPPSSKSDQDPKESKHQPRR
jgi:hypothetical protein